MFDFTRSKTIICSPPIQIGQESALPGFDNVYTVLRDSDSLALYGVTTIPGQQGKSQLSAEFRRFCMESRPDLANKNLVFEPGPASLKALAQDLGPRVTELTE